MVETHSATQKCSRDPEEVHSIDKDHSAMVKFGTGDLNYICVLDCIRGVLDQLSPLSGGSQRQATDRSFISEETDGQDHDGEIQALEIEQEIQRNRSKKRSAKGWCFLFVHVRQHTNEAIQRFWIRYGWTYLTVV